MGHDRLSDLSIWSIQKGEHEKLKFSSTMGDNKYLIEQHNNHVFC